MLAVSHALRLIKGRQMQERAGARPRETALAHVVLPLAMRWTL